MALPPEKEPKIIAFVCNWCAYAGADQAGVARIAYPPHVRLIRVMCTGRIHHGFLLNAFHQGADGVLVSGCHEGDCHYIEGNIKCKKVVQETHAILRLLGVSTRRLRLKWVSPSEGALFAEEIRDFVKMLKTLGPDLPTPKKIDPNKPGKPDRPDKPEAAVPFNDKPAPHLPTPEQLEYCLECNLCTSTCPASRVDARFSPKQIIRRSALGQTDDLIHGSEIWSCLTCGHCNIRCPAQIDFPELNRENRLAARRAGNVPRECHHGIFQYIGRLQSQNIRQQKTAWAKKAGRIRKSGDYFYFVGCLPFFDVVFDYLNLKPLEGARSALRLLNRVGVEPVISDDECCCGHDAFWSGDDAVFMALARINLEVIKASGAKTVIFGCPEGYLAFREYYPKYFGPLPFETIHLSEFLMQRLPKAGLSFAPGEDERITYQDPCRLGRGAGIFDAPRKLLNMIPGSHLTEMERNRENALCCGTSGWMGCDAGSKSIQTERLQEAKETGAKTLITACPKCNIHLSCAQNDLEMNLKIEDIYTYLLRHLKD